MEINRDKLIRALRDNCKCLLHVKNCSGCAEKHPQLCKQERQLFKAAADMLEADGATDTNVGSKWEPVSDPPPTGEVMAYSKKSGEMIIGYIHSNGTVDEWCCESDEETLYDVTHWMPKPVPPEEVEA